MNDHTSPRAAAPGGLTFEAVFDKVAAIVADALRVDIARVTPDANLLIDLNAESIDLVDIRFRLEEAFGFRVDQREFIASLLAGSATGGDIQDRITVRNLVAYILRRMAVPE